MRAALFLLIPLLLAPSAAFAQGTAARALRVEVEGVRGEQRDNVLAGLAIHQRRAEPELWGARVRRLHEQAPDEIRAALRPFGHYTPTVEAELTETPSGWRARYRIDPGPAVRVTEADVRILGPGADDASLTTRAAAFPLRVGDPLRHDVYEDGKLELLTVATERGFLQARLDSSRVWVDTTSLEARVVVHLATGERHRFGAVEFVQNGFSDELLRGFVPFRTGDPYSTAELLALQRALIESDFFRGVDVRARPDLADGIAVPVEVTLEARPRRLYSLGAGYGTDTGPRGSAALDVRRLNRWGHRLNGDVRASPTRSAVGTRYLIPVGAAGEQFALSLGFQDERPTTVRAQTLLFGGSLLHRRGSWQERLYLNLQQEWFEVGGDRSTTRLVLPGANWSRTRSDDPIHTTRGSRVVLDVRGTDGVLGSEVSFVQAALRSKWIRSPHENGRLILRAEGGVTRVGDFAQLPPTMRFFAGGDGSVRGYGYQALGPRDEEGKVLGARHLAVGSVEYERRFFGDWGAAAFWDAGNALDGAADGIRHGVGAGIRWLSPVGMVRLDVASAVSEPGRPFRVHVVIGPDL